MDAVISRQVRRTVAAWAGMLLAAALLTACSAPSPPDPVPASSAAPSAGSSSRTGPSSSSTPADLAGQKAIAAYLGMWEDMAVAAETSDWQDPSLGDHATGTALTKITRGLYADAANGLVTKGRPKNHPRVTSVEPPSAPTKVIITDCGDDSEWRHHRGDTGELADDGPSGRRRIDAVVEKQQDGAWRVTDFGVHEVGSC